jgi:hypothetical protein
LKKSLSFKKKKNWIFFKNKIFVSRFGKFFFVKNKNINVEFKLFNVFFSERKKLNFNKNLKYWNLYCSFDQFLWAMGAFVKVNLLFLTGKIKIFILFFVLEDFWIKFK